MDYHQLDDQALIRLIAWQQPEALSEFYDRHSRLVFSLARSIVGDASTAEEITMDVFERVWERADTYQVSRAQVSTWLTSITRHRSIDVLRRQRVRPEVHTVGWDDLAGEVVSDQPSPEASAETALARQRVRDVLAQLPIEQGQVLSMAYYQGYSQGEIARRLDLPLGTVKTRIRLGMQKLRRELESTGWAGA